MTKRVLVYKEKGNYYVSQEFNGDRTEMIQLQRIFGGEVSVKSNWEDIVQPIYHLRNLDDFKKAVLNAEEVYGYEHLPLIELEAPPVAEEVWMYIGLVMQLYSKYDEIIYHDVIFTYLNCNGQEITRTYPKVKDFFEELRSDKIDIPMLDDEITSLKIFGVDFEVVKGTVVHWIANYLS